MVQLNLPKNSKVTEGRRWARPAGARETRENATQSDVSTVVSY
jgi:hypothetical protein